MPTDKPRILLTLSDELLEEIDDYRYKNRIPARTEAIRQFVITSYSIHYTKLYEII